MYSITLKKSIIFFIEKLLFVSNTYTKCYGTVFKAVIFRRRCLAETTSIFKFRGSWNWPFFHDLRSLRSSFARLCQLSIFKRHRFQNSKKEQHYLRVFLLFSLHNKSSHHIFLSILLLVNSFSTVVHLIKAQLWIYESFFASKGIAICSKQIAVWESK